LSGPLLFVILQRAASEDQYPGEETRSNQKARCKKTNAAEKDSQKEACPATG